METIKPCSQFFIWFESEREIRHLYCILTSLHLQCVLISWDPPPPPAPHWTYIRGRYWSAKIDDISLWHPVRDITRNKRHRRWTRILLSVSCLDQTLLLLSISCCRRPCLIISNIIVRFFKKLNILRNVTTVKHLRMDYFLDYLPATTRKETSTSHYPFMAR